MFEDWKDRLPEHKAPEDVWKKIEAELTPQQSQEEILLPEHRAPAYVWDKLSEQLKELPNDTAVRKTAEVRMKERKKIQRRIVFGLSLAASIALLLWVSLDSTKSRQGTLIHSEEEMAWTHFETQLDLTEQTPDDDIMKFIDEHCIASLPACDTELFADLFELYKSLHKAGETIREESNLNQSDPELVHSWTYIEKEKAEIGKQLIDLILS